MGDSETGRRKDPGPVPSQELLARTDLPLAFLFSPRSVAVIGAGEAAGDLGRMTLWNLVSSPFGGTVYPISRRHGSILGIKTYPSVGAAPEPVDLAVITTAADAVPGVISECAAAHVKGAIIISGGLRERGPDGEKLEREVLSRARAAGLRLVGPDCLGVMSPVTGLNASCAGAMARPGNVGFVSQSGALATAVLDWSLREMVGFSHFVTIGSMIDVGWGDLIDHLGDDPRTRCILIYMESIGDARSFLSAAREVALAKPIIVMKAGRTAAAARAATSHTGAMAGRDDVLEAAFRRCGVLRVHTIADLFYMAETLSKQPRPRGCRLTILTNAGGPGVLAADALIMNGGELAELSPETRAGLDRILPADWSRANPVDILGDASPERYSRAAEILSRDPQSDGLLVILAPQALTDPTGTAEALEPFARLESRPILASWMGGAVVSAGESALNRAGIPTFSYPDTAARAFQYMWRYSYNLRSLYETPHFPVEVDPESSSRVRAEAIIGRARAGGRTLLTEPESKELLAAYRIPVNETLIATGETEAVRHAAALGYPVALKILAEGVTHKSEIGGVHLDLPDAGAVRQAFRSLESAAARLAGTRFQGATVQRMAHSEGFEVILCCVQDPQFGPVLLFGSGGLLAEIYRDRALALPPLNSTLARRMMEQTSLYRALRGFRGREPVDMPALEKILVRFSQLLVEQPWIAEIDVNPLLVSAQGHLVLDARVVLHDCGVSLQDLPGLAVRPYPIQYVWRWVMKDGTPVTIRPIRPEDEPLMVKFHETLSDLSVYFRYFHPMRLTQRVTHERLVRMCFIDYSREMALVVEMKHPQGEGQEIVGVGRLIRMRGISEAEFAIIVSDRIQKSGLGTELLGRLVEIGRAEKLGRITGDILPDNAGMLRVCEKLGFRCRYSTEEGVIKAEIVL